MGTELEYSSQAPSQHHEGDLALPSFEGVNLLTRQTLPKLARLAAVTTFALGVIALLGWWLHFPLFESLWPGRPRMVPATAFALVLVGFGLWTVLPEPVTLLGRLRFGAGQLAGLAAVALGGGDACARPAQMDFSSNRCFILKLTGISGFEVLSWLRGQPKFDGLPVLILTASIHPEDRARALALGADAFVVKSVDFDDLQLLVQALNRLLQTPRPRDLRSFSPLQQSAFFTL